MLKTIFILIALSSTALAQNLVPLLERAKPLVESGTFIPAGVTFSRTKLPNKVTDKRSNMYYVTYRSPFTAQTIEIQMVETKEEEAGDQGDPAHPLDICVVNYGNPSYTTDPQKSQFDTIFDPTLLILSGDRNHTNCSNGEPDGALCYNAAGTKLICCCGPDPRAENCPSFCPGNSLTASSATTAATAVPYSLNDLIIFAAYARQTAIELRQIVAAVPFKNKYAYQHEQLLYALKAATASTKANSAGNSDSGYRSDKEKDDPFASIYGEGEAGLSNFLALPPSEASFGGFTRDIIPPEDPACSLGPIENPDPAFFWRHWIGLYTAPTGTWSRPFCADADGPVYIDKGRCEHCGSILARYNPLIPNSLQIMKVNGNHGRAPCTDSLACPNGMFQKCWWRSGTNRTSHMHAQSCGTFHSLFSNWIPTKLSMIKKPGPNGHNCNDDCTTQLNAIIFNYHPDPYSGVCNDPQGHYSADNCNCPNGATANGCCL